MKKRGFALPIATGLSSLAIFVVGWILQAQKAEIDMWPAECFDRIMALYRVGNALITISLYLALASLVIWIVTAILVRKK